MTSLTMADLSRHTRQALASAQETEVVILSNGQPTGILIGIDGLDAAEAMRIARRILTERAVAAIQAEAVEHGLSAMTLDDINGLIAETRPTTR
jgi:hypothetical protein